MKLTRSLTLALLTLPLGACATFQDVKDIKLIGFSDDVHKGKSAGQFESDDCVYRVLGYALGGAPDVSRAIANARTRTKSNLTDAVMAKEAENDGLRYVNNVSANYGGFDAWVVAKSCIEVKGVGYL